MNAWPTGSIFSQDHDFDWVIRVLAGSKWHILDTDSRCIANQPIKQNSRIYRRSLKRESLGKQRLVSGNNTSKTTIRFPAMDLRVMFVNVIGVCSDRRSHPIISDVISFIGSDRVAKCAGFSEFAARRRQRSYSVFAIHDREHDCGIRLQFITHRLFTHFVRLKWV